MEVDLERWVVDFRPKLQTKKQSIALELAGGPLPAVCCDVEKIEQVVVNLIANAHKFTPEGGRITVSAQPAGDFVRVAVEDTGIGIALEDQARIFDPFVQIRRQDGPGARGTGLGLAICRKIVDLHGGSLAVASEVGRGATNSFTVPIDQPHAVGSASSIVEEGMSVVVS